jgi:hypothetical protein
MDLAAMRCSCFVFNFVPLKTMEEAFELINRMQADKIIGRYAIGGAVGATLYLEPAATLDIDIFVSLSGDSGSSLLSVAPIYDYLKARGGYADGEHAVIGGWPVQFLPVSNAVEEERLREAVAANVGGYPGLGDEGRTPGGHCIANRTGKGPRENPAIYRAGCG